MSTRRHDAARDAARRSVGRYGGSVNHSIGRYCDYLRSALRQDRRPLGVFLGAGAPMAVRVAGEPLIPDIDGLTRVVRRHLKGKSREVVEAAAEQVQGDINLEGLLDYLRRLAAVPGPEPVRGFDRAVVERADQDICALISAKLTVTLPESNTPFHSLALWSRSAQRHAPLELFTTNYDLLLEQALESMEVPYFDGFAGGVRPIFDLHAVEEDQLPVRWVRLWKLHGSINWVQDSLTSAIVRTAASDGREKTLIYPSHLKYDQSRRQPYLVLLDRLRGFLRQPSAVLVTCGFSFRDEHINDVLGQAMRANPTASVQALMFGSLDEYTEALRLAGRTPNLSLLARNGAVVGSRRGDWDSDAADEEQGNFPYGDFARFGELLLTVMGAVLPDNSARVAAAASDSLGADSGMDVAIQ